MNIRKILLTFFLLLFFLPVPEGKAVPDQEKQLRVLVARFQSSINDEESGWPGIGLTEYLNLSLKESNGITLVNGIRAKKDISPEQRFTKNKVIEIGKVLDADKVVWGNFKLSKNRITIITRITDVKTGMVTELTRQKGKWEEIFLLEEKILEKILLVLNKSQRKKGRERVNALIPQSPPAYEHYLRGKYYLLEKNDYSHALVEFNKAITLEPDFPLAWAFIGETYLILANSGNSKCMVKKAEEASKKALLRVPDLALARKNLAICCFHQKDLTRAEKELEKAISLNPKNARIRFLLGTIYHHQEKFDRAINEYRQVIGIDPHYSKIHHNLCVVYYKQSKPNLAKKEGLLALKEDPMNPDVHFILGNIYFDLEKWDQAVAEYQIVKGIDSGYPNIHYSLAMSYHRDGNLEKAIGEYQKAVESGNIKQACLNRGMIYYRKNNFDSAKKDFQAFLKSNPTCQKSCCLAHNCLAAIYHQEGKLDTAMEQYRRVLNCNPQSSEAHYRLGTIYYQQEKYPGAVKEYREALQLNPNYKEAHFNLALVLEKNRKYPGAIDHFKKFISLASPSDEKLIKEAKKQIRLLKKIEQ